jgi:hypothetical protein
VIAHGGNLPALLCEVFRVVMIGRIRSVSALRPLPFEHTRLRDGLGRTITYSVFPGPLVLVSHGEDRASAVLAHRANNRAKCISAVPRLIR